MSADSATPRSGLTILVVDDHPLAREAVTRLVADLDPEATVLEADSLAAACQVLETDTQIALAVVEVALPGVHGLEALARLREARPGLPMLVLTSSDATAAARTAVDAGARGYISKRSPTALLIEAIRLVLVGGIYIPPEALNRAVASRLDPDRSAEIDAPGHRTSDGHPSLTPRQRDVLALLLQGQPNKQICRTLDLAEGTVKTHTAAIYRALNVTNRTQAAYAVSRLRLRLPRPGDARRRPDPMPAHEGCKAAVNPPLGRQQVIDPADVNKSQNPG